MIINTVLTVKKKTTKPTDNNAYDFGERIYDPRIGKFFTTDLLTNVISWQSPYSFAANSPIKFIDVNGNGPKDHILLRKGKAKEVHRIARKKNIQARLLLEFLRLDWEQLVLFQKQQIVKRARQELISFQELLMAQRLHL